MQAYGHDVENLVESLAAKLPIKSARGERQPPYMGVLATIGDLAQSRSGSRAGGGGENVENNPMQSSRPTM